MTHAELAEVRRLFLEACEVPVDRRAAHVAGCDVSSAQVRRAVEELLASDQREESRADGKGSEADTNAGLDTDGVPARIGGFTIERVLGEGGMGVAYLARQSSPEREVALKVLRLASSSRSGRARFDREVRILGRLVHPCIARIYEAGHFQTETGRSPYFTMEYIGGLRITEFVRANAVAREEIIELVAKVADAVQHAHTQGVIHRDLKPANILIRPADSGAEPAGEPSGRGAGAGVARPVILDFGVARLLDPEEDEEGAITEAGQIFGTISYMSPEQLRGELHAVDARSDVYSLGVILFELLTNSMPHDLRGRTVAEAATIVNEQETAALSAAAGARSARFDPDLETIVHRALARERELRYQTAAEFAADLRRFLACEPIAARPATVAYQVSKFARRHRALVVGAAAVSVALVAGLAVSLVMYFRAESLRVIAETNRGVAEQQRMLADSREKQSASLQTYLLEDLLAAGSTDRMGPDVSLADAVLQARLVIASRFKDQPELEVRVRERIEKVLTSLGRTDESVEECERIHQIYSALLGPNDPATIDAMVSEAGSLARAQKHGRARELANDAYELAKAHLRPDDPVVLRAAIRYAGCEQARRHYGKAVETLQSVLASLEKDRALVDTYEDVLVSLMRCERGRKRAEEARVYGEQLRAVIAGRDAGPEMPVKSAIRMLALHRALDEDAQAAAVADAILPKLEAELVPMERAVTLRLIAQTYVSAERWEDAERAALRCCALLDRSHRFPTPQNATPRKILLNVYDRWPGHSVQAARVAMEMFRISLMQPGEGALKQVVRDYAVLDACYRGYTGGDILEAAWPSMEIWAPQGHELRAILYENFGAVAVSAQRDELAARAGVLAAEARPYALPRRHDGGM